MLALLAGVGYMFARDYVAGYLDMTKWANPNVATNYTVGFFLLFAIVGMLGGELVLLAMKLLRVKWQKQARLVAIAAGALLFSMMFAEMMAATGMIQGGRFG